MKKAVSLFILSAIMLSAFAFASCSEAEPLPEGVSELPDLDASELTASLADETGEIQWPAELLPEGFPVPKYEEIYSVEREDNELRIVLLSKRKYGSDFPEQLYSQKLLSLGYVFYVPENFEGGTMPAVNREGWRVQLAASRSSEWLKPLAEKYGYAYEINVRQTVLEVPDSLFWKYPSPDTDLGYERKKLDEWPADLLPENIPVPDAEKIKSMEVRPNGVFITVKDRVGFENKLFEAGYYEMSLQPHRDKDGNYFYIEYGATETIDGEYYITIVFQFCKYNEYIEK